MSPAPDPDPLLRPGDRAGTWVLRRDGMDQSQVDLADPTRLDFPYVRRLADVLDAHGAPGTPLRVVHVGGGAMTLARYVAATRPGSPRSSSSPTRPCWRRCAASCRCRRAAASGSDRSTAGRGSPRSGPGRADLLVLDAFDGGRVPADLVSLEALAAMAAALRADGLLLLNLVDRAPFAWTRRVVAGVRSLLPDVLLTAEPATLRARRAGNLVVVAGSGGVPVAQLGRRTSVASVPYRVLDAAQVSSSFGGGRAFTDRDTQPSPPTQQP